MNNSLGLKGVSKGFKSFTPENISFELPKGFVMGLIGPNGAGKTAAIKLITAKIMAFIFVHRL